jgi:hypothetical protein
VSRPRRQEQRDLAQHPCRLLPVRHVPAPFEGNGPRGPLREAGDPLQVLPRAILVAVAVECERRTVVSVCTTGEDAPDTGLVQVVERPNGGVNVLVLLPRHLPPALDA